MPRINSSAVLLFLVVHLTTSSSLAGEIQIDEHTLCSAALHAFDAKDSPVIQDFFQFAQSVFKELDSKYIKGGERTINKALTDKSIAGPVVFGRCVQHPTATIYEH